VLKDMKVILPTKMNNKILIYSLVLVVITIIGSNLIYREINNRLLFDSISKVNKQTITYIQSNIENVINSVNSYSKLIIGDENIQNILDKDKHKILKRQAIVIQLNTLMESTPFISDIYLSDMEGNLYVAYKDKVINPDYLNSEVVAEAIRKKGSYSLHLNGKDLFRAHGEEAFISFVRAIRNLDTQEIIGIVIINIPVTHLVHKQDGTSDDLIQDLYIVTKDDMTIPSVMLSDHGLLLKPKLKQVNGYHTEKIQRGGQDYLVSSLWIEALDWYIVNTISLNQSRGIADDYKMAIVIIIAINLVFIFIGVAIFSALFVRPMKLMIATIKHNGDNLEWIDLNTNIYELKQLELEYNNMMAKINLLIQSKVEEQKSLRKKELELLQAQIKPHFLYNTLDTIKLLSKKGENEMAFQAVNALGKFYRSSLGKGEETIRIVDELDIIENYMRIQNFRYKDICELKIQLDPDLSNMKILRLILQPLVENALYHGLKPKGEAGRITICVFRKEECVQFVIEDDGVGFDAAMIAGVNSTKEESIKLKGYGVYNTIERLKIFYGDSVDFIIESARGVGTKIIIRIPEALMDKPIGLGEKDV
jgi:two-component system, sensor histidine kinase YesM